jgi:hypothetical protein
MPFPDLSGLPVWAQVLIYAILGLAIAIAFLVARFGLLQGSKASPEAGGQAQVAAVIVDPTALNKATAEVAGLSVAITEATVVARTHNDATDRLADNVEELSKRVDRLTDKVIDAAAKLK